MLKQKSLKAVLICLIAIFSASCFSLLFVNAYSVFSKEEAEASTTTSLYDDIDYSDCQYYEDYIDKTEKQILFNYPIDHQDSINL